MRLWISAGEASGDALAGALVSRFEGAEVRGLAGPSMRDSGVQPVAKAEQATALGLAEVVPRLPGLLRLGHRLVEDALRWRPDVVVTVDSPGLLLPVAQRLRNAGIPTLHWGSPQVWAWRAHRVEQVAGSVDTLCCLFPFEPSWYSQQPVRVRYTGHPACLVPPRVRPERPGLLVLPGSRPQEVRALWPVLRRVARAWRERTGGEIHIAIAPTIDPMSLDLDGVKHHATVREAAAWATEAVVCSGTASLEVAMAGVPQVVVYRSHPATHLAARLLLRRLEHVALPNLIMGHRRVPEFIQNLRVLEIVDVLTCQREDDAQRLAGDLRQVLGGEDPIASVAGEVDRLRGG